MKTLNILGEPCHAVTTFNFRGYEVKLDSAKYQVSFTEPNGRLHLASSVDTAITNIIAMEKK